MMTAERLEELEALTTGSTIPLIASCELKEALIEIRRIRSTCPVYHLPCKTHGYIHGQEAEELRSGLDNILENLSVEGDEIDINDYYIRVQHLRDLLEETDARDSCGYLEAKRKAGELKTQLDLTGLTVEGENE